jgi:hypothetical protein
MKKLSGLARPSRKLKARDPNQEEFCFVHLHIHVQPSPQSDITHGKLGLIARGIAKGTMTLSVAWISLEMTAAEWRIYAVSLFSM